MALFDVCEMSFGYSKVCRVFSGLFYKRLIVSVFDLLVGVQRVLLGRCSTGRDSCRMERYRSFSATYA